MPHTHTTGYECTVQDFLPSRALCLALLLPETVVVAIHLEDSFILCTQNGQREKMSSFFLLPVNIFFFIAFRFSDVFCKTMERVAFATQSVFCF